MSEKRIARVFPTKTNMCPTDKDAYFGLPTLWTPQYDEVHISITFTWDILRIPDHVKLWEPYGKIKVDGPALNNPGGEFVSGMYLKKGITITSRGCPWNCHWCFIPKREGKIRQLPIITGNIIQDNNLLACQKPHIKKVFEMLLTQNAVEFRGGLDCSLLRDWIIDELRCLKIHALWVSYDHPSRLPDLKKAVAKLRRYFPRDKLRCYVLIGQKGDTLEKAERRLEEAWHIGTLPFAMRFRTPELKWEQTYIHAERGWNILARQWTRPAITKARMKHN